MCLSTVYRKTISPENIIMKNVRAIECRGREITLTDLMDRQITVTGELALADLTGGEAVISEE